MTKTKQAIYLSNLEIELENTLRKIKLHEGIINSVKIEARAKKTSRRMLEGLMVERQKLSDLIIETLLLKE
jgi:hypothetical protein